MIIEVYVLAASKIVLKNAAYRMTRVAIAEQDPKQVNLLRILFEQTRMKAKQFLDLSRKVCRYSEYSLKESYPNSEILSVSHNEEVDVGLPRHLA